MRTDRGPMTSDEIRVARLRLAELWSSRSVRLEFCISSLFLILGTTLLALGLYRSCVLLGISGGLLVGFSLGTLLLLPHQRQLYRDRLELISYFRRRELKRERYR